MNRVIKIIGRLDDEHELQIAQDILKAERDPNVTNIVLFISSGGGSTEHINTIWEVIKMCEKPVCAIGSGRVASTAAAIFMMAPIRILLPGTVFLLHKSSTSLKGNFTVDDLKEILAETKMHDQILLGPVITNGYIQEDVLYKKCERRDWILTSDEIGKYGIITDTYTNEIAKELMM